MRTQALAAFGTADALSQGMMPTLIELNEPTHRPCCTGEQARQMLESLRAAYQSLKLPEQILVKSAITQAAREQSVKEWPKEQNVAD